MDIENTEYTKFGLRESMYLVMLEHQACEELQVYLGIFK